MVVSKYKIVYNINSVISRSNQCCYYKRFGHKRAMNFPLFPTFRKLVPEDRDDYLAVYKHVDPYSDFSFNNLIIWLDLEEDLEISHYKGCVILRFTNPFEHSRRETAYTIMGYKNCLEVIEAIFAYQAQQELPQKLIMVPESVVSNALQATTIPQEFVIRASQDHCDYVFTVDEVLTAQGKHYEQLRRNLRIFYRENPGQIDVVTLDLAKPETHHYLLDALSKWQENAGFIKNDPTFDEPRALNRYFTYPQACPAECRAFLLNGTIFGFSIIHKPPQKDWAIFNHLKCSRDVPNGYDFIYHYILGELAKDNVSKVNFEQDLGIPGLRLHKRQLGRSEFLYRYDISRL